MGDKSTAQNSGYMKLHSFNNLLYTIVGGLLLVIGAITEEPLMIIAGFLSYIFVEIRRLALK